MTEPTDTERLDWLERNFLSLSHNRASCSVDMGGINVRGQFNNEALGDGAGPSIIRPSGKSIREIIDKGMNWKDGQL